MGQGLHVSINSTSEEVRSVLVKTGDQVLVILFPLIQLPRKSEVLLVSPSFGLICLVSINSTSEEVRRSWHKFAKPAKIICFH